ncbi:MAG: hypothetical protein HUU34_06030 [Saprospiraceae bacterium]|jgi:hypothetical protein|nr:hypothetical protein [Saprospiraceae bacterium]
MLLKFRKSAEPLSPNAETEPIILAKSQAYYILSRELERYRMGDTGGRSILISGHRGSGKTTLVHSAIQEQRKKLRDLQKDKTLLVVDLHGPNLLSTPLTPSTDSADNPPADAAQLAVIQQTLKQITIALYRSLSKEIAFEFERRTGDAELTAQLKLELDNASPPDVFRQFWAKAGRLDDRGFKELIALTSAAQAYQMVSGQIEETIERKQTAEAKQSLSVESNNDSRDNALKSFADALIGLFTGAAAGATVLFNTDFKGLLAAAVGMGATLLTIFGLQYTSSRSKEKKEDRTLKFIPDRSVSTLDRQLPVLVNRLREAGYIPVFVVDELDKVIAYPYEQFGNLVAYLKFFIAERSFFCFLTDRNYFDYLNDLSRQKPYPKEHTYFTHRLFVLHRPADLHNFYNDQLLMTDPTGATAVLDSGTGLSGTLQNPILDDTEIQLLSYLLLHKARMHAFDLRQLLSNLITQDDLIQLPNGLRTYLGYRFHILIQVTIEWLLNQGELKARLDQEPHFGQLAYDTLYYPSRCWEKGEPELDARKESLEKYLNTRTLFNHQLHQANTPQDNQDHHLDQADSTPKLKQFISQSDLDFLHDQLLKLISKIFIDPEQVFDDLKINGTIQEQANIQNADVRHQIQQAIVQKHHEFIMDLRYTRPVEISERAREGVIGSISDIIGVQNDLELLEPLGDNRYRWRFDSYGRKLREEVPPDLEELIKNCEALFHPLNDYLEELSDHTINLELLAYNYGIIRTTPGWFDVITSLDRLKRYHKNRERYDQLDSDRIALSDYLRILTEASPVIAKSILMAAELGSIANEQPGVTLANGMDTIRMFSIPADQYEKYVAGLKDFQPDDYHLEKVSLDKWKKNVDTQYKKSAVPLPKTEVDGLTKNWWQLWEKRMEAYLSSDKASFELDRLDLLMYASRLMPVGMLHPQFDKINIQSWSYLLLLSFENNPDDKYQSYRLGMAIPAMKALGLHSTIDRFASLLNQSSFSTRFKSETISKIKATWEQYQKAPSFKTRTFTKAVIIISNYIIDWQPSNLYSVFVIPFDLNTRESYPNAYQMLLNDIFKPEDFHQILIQKGSEDYPETSYTAILPDGYKKIPVAWIVSYFVSSQIKTSLPIVRDPLNLEQAMAALESKA